MNGALLQPFGDHIYLMDGDPVRMLGIPFETRMTVIRLSSGALWIHSPIAPNDERRNVIDAIGPVTHLVAPCTFHHLFVASWQEHYPSAKTWAAPGLPARLPERRFDSELSDVAPAEWSGEIEQLVFRGSKVLVEVVFFHRPSKTLIFTDIVQNHDPNVDGWFWRNVKRVNAASAPDGGVPRDYRLTVRDRDAARKCRDQMLAWPFDRVALTHGHCITKDAHAHIERAFAWLD